MSEQHIETEKTRGISFATIEAEMAMIMAIPMDDMSDEDYEKWDAYVSWLEGLEAKKVDSFYLFIREQEGRRDAIKAEAKRLNEKAAAIDRNIGNLKARYLQTMQAYNKQKIQGTAVTLSIRTDKVVRLVDENAIPEKFWKIKEERSVDRAAIKRVLKDGGEVQGAILADSFSLQAR